MESELQLIDAIRAGDRSALRRLYERYLGYALAVSLRYIPVREDAEDVVQDSFVKILTTISQFQYKGEGSLRSWVSRIVANKAVDYLRHNGRITFVSTLPETLADEAPDVERVPPDILTRLIAQLPAGYRVVLNLHVFEHCSHKEIAERLGIKENSAGSQFSRAKLLLAKKIKDYLNNEKI